VAVLLTRAPLDPAAVLAAVADPSAGGTVLFVGTVRDLTGDVATVSLEYEAHEPLARALLAGLAAAAADRFGLVAVAVAEWLMEAIKREVPIWKCEHRPDGSHAWVHGGQRPGGDE